MADNITVKDASGNNIIVKTKDVGAGVQSAQNVLSDTSGAALIGRAAAAASLPVVLSTEDSAAIGALTETAPATDTASSALNGRLQRVAQRLSSLIALLPTALGTGGGLKVDGSGTALPVSGTVTARAQDGGGNALTSATRGSERALSVQIVDGSGNQVTTFGGAGGTSSNVGSADPSAATASGFSDGTNMQLARAFDADTGGGTEYVIGSVERVPASGGSVTKTFGAGAVAPGTQRVTLASDDPAVSYTSRLLTGALPTAGGTATSTTAQAVGGTYNATPITLTDTQQAGVQLDASGRLLTTTKLDATDQLVVAVGAKTDAKSTATDGTVNLTQVAKQCSASLQALVTALGGALDLGAGTVGANTQRVTIGTDDGVAAVLGATSGSAVITDATGTVQQYLRGLIKQWIAGTLVLGAGSNLVGKVTIDQTTPGTTNRVDIGDIAKGEYDDVAASTTRKLGGTGAVGDYLAGITIFPETTSPAEVTLQDGNGTAISIFKGGATSVSNLVPFYLPFGDYAKVGTTAGWTVVTGTNVHVRGHGNFT